MIKVWNKDIKFIGYITKTSSVQWHSKFADYGNFEIHIPLYNIDFELTAKYNIVQFNNNFGFILKRYQNSKEIVIAGYDLNGLTARRIKNFDSGYDGIEVMLKEYMSGLLGDVGTSGINQLNDSTQKITISEFGKLYRCSEWLKKAYDAYGVGYRIYLRDNTIKYDILTQQKTSLVFSEKYKNILDFTYTEENYNDYNTVGYNKLYNGRYYVGSIEDNSYTGNKIMYNRLPYNDETFNVNTLGEALLWEEQRKVINYLSNSVNITESIEFKSNLIYGVDYNLGDIVTVEINAFGKGISKEVTISEVQEAHEPNKTEYTITTGTKGDNYIKRLINKGVI